jgi:5-methylcytosine-specific restriction endonuclease McrA
MSEYRFVKCFNKKTSNKLTSKQVRTLDYGDNWSEISETCLRLANRICASCGGRANRAHHIIPRSKGGSNAQSNLMALCDVCHKKKHRHLRSRVE